MTALVGVDVGTSSTKAIAIDPDGTILGHAQVEYPVSLPRPGHAEQDPDLWWQAAEAALADLGAEDVAGIGLSGQMHGLVLLDDRLRPLRPAILWNDQRTAAECDEIEATVGLERLIALTGNRALTGFTAPKLLWVREHEPHLFARTACVLLPKDWLRLQLTGERVSEMSDASGTLWLDVGARRWSDELLAACGFTRSHMPRLVEGNEVSGQLRRGAADRWGLRPGIPVAGGAGDNAASAIGIGAVQPNQGFVSLGTSGVIFVASDRYRPDPASGVHTFCHAMPGRWHHMSVMLSAASALRWARELLGLSSEEVLLDKVAGLTTPQRASAPLFLPYLSGERTPHNDPNAQGVLFGLTHAHDAASMGYAVIEGVSFGMADGWASLRCKPGSVSALSLVGGGARSELWAQLLASTLRVTLRAHVGAEAGAALGAARLAWLADGGDETDVCRGAAVTREFRPDASDVELLAPRLVRFRALYLALRSHFEQVDG
jgi:xylulokinase